MLNKELLMAVGEGLEPVLSIYISPGNPANVFVYASLSSGGGMTLTTKNTERKTFKFSEIDANSSINLSYSLYLARISFNNLINSSIKPRAPENEQMRLWIEDVTQSASLVIEEV